MIFVGSKEIDEINMYAKKSQSEVIMTYFYSFEYLDCSRVTSFKDELRYMSVLYAMTSVLIALSLMRPFSKKPTIV